ncbi:glycosyltransferase [Streptomyces sp. p1417]|uniref:Glycosyltransferase n=1 Tax=Streptomyces typhae TaxID=2681492 RepID=A0A6L6WY17_9ACTN|nr:glycosyltransferase family 39 protein [Streptomyces typhae]MVO86387.1 glycosyltransferase [Streptomyces typhae]
MPVEPLAPSRSVSIVAAGTTGTVPGHRTYWPRLLPALALLACATRLPSFTRPLWNPDEGFLAVQARLLADGGELYETVVDRKPPLVPWLYRAAFAVAGDQSLTSVRVLAIGAQLLTAVLLASLARRRWGDRAGRTAGVLYLLASVGLNPEDAQAATFEIFMLPCTAAAMWSADRRRWGPAGAAVACAFLAKQTGGAVLVPVVWLLWRSGAEGAGAGFAGGARHEGVRFAGGTRRVGVRFAAGAWHEGVRFAAGVAGPVLAAALLTDPGGFVFWTVTGSGAYASFTGSELHVLSRGLANTALLGAACAGFLPPVLRVLRVARTGAADLWLWLGSSAGAVVLGFHFFGHYFLQLTPPLALLGTVALQILPGERTVRAVLTSACACSLFVSWGLLAPRTDLAHAEHVAASVRGRTAPGDRVLVWGMHPETYWLADRTPASRYLTAGLLTNYSGGRDGPQVGEEYAVEGSWDVFRAELAARPPAIVVDDSRGKPFGPERVVGFRRVLRGGGYVRVGVVGGAVVYARGAEQWCR